MGSSLSNKVAGWVVAAFILALPASQVSAQAQAQAATKGMPDCASGQCTWSMLVDGNTVLSGEYAANADGSLFVPDQQTRAELGDGSFVSVNGLSGNIDPILGFSLGAGTAAAGKTFSFAFSLPIALSGLIDARSSVSYSLSSTSSAGAQISPLAGAGRMVVAQEVDTSVGGLLALNKGVDVGNLFSFVGGPQTQNSSIFTASNSFVGNSAYDLMSVVVSFSLSPNSQVGISGFVEQVLAVPEPGSAVLMVMGLLALSAAARRQRQG